MFSELITNYAPFAVAAAVLVPVLVAHVAMFAENFRTKQWSAAATR